MPLVFVCIDSGNNGNSFPAIEGTNRFFTLSHDNLEVKVDLKSKKWQLSGELSEEYKEELDTSIGDSLSRVKSGVWGIVLDSSNTNHLAHFAQELYFSTYNQVQIDGPD